MKKCNSDNGCIMINVDVSVKNMYVEKTIFGILLHVVVKMESIYLASIMDDSAIVCNEIIESYDKETKAIPRNFNQKKATCKTQSSFYW